ncbi:MAG: hypothetical protein JWL81_8, partial [Verrucomicrobiales bacterium]|nr:hypothetical protein [Verrucomicrobiales bacterium]
GNATFQVAPEHRFIAVVRPSGYRALALGKPDSFLCSGRLL